MQVSIKLMSDDLPGVVARYSLREVLYTPEVPVCVTVDGVCNHADTDYEEVALSHRPEDTEMAEVCVGCGAIYNEHVDEWLR